MIRKSRSLWGIVLALGVGGAAQESMRWEADYEPALQRAKELGKLLAVHFWADW